ncbi:MAG: M48 family metalloprotease [Acidobacteria bacterium]|nr:M48 family metalloprotease [Acidobacteriota bacterium]
MGFLVAVIVAAVAILLVWRRGRQVLAQRVSPTVAEQWWHARQASNQIAVTATIVVALLAGHRALWLLPALWVALTAVWFAARRPLYGETWGFARYLSWQLRVIAVIAGPPLLVVIAPVVVDAAGSAWAVATGAIALLVAVHLLGSRRLAVSLLQAEPLDAGGIPTFSHLAAEVTARSTAPEPELLCTEVTGGRWVNALAIAHRTSPAVVFSRPLLEALDPRQLAAIYAHEVAHLEHFTPRLLRIRAVVLCTLAVLALALVPVGRLLVELPSWAPVAWLAAGLITIAVAQARHREQETACDRRAVELCGDAEALAAALIILHELNLLPRRMEQSQDVALTHPSLARRLQAIRASADAKTPPQSSLPFRVVGARDGQFVLLEDERITWFEGIPETADRTPDSLRRAASSSRSFAYDELTELRVRARARGPKELVAVDRSGTRRVIPIADDTVGPLQAVLDEVDSRLGSLRLPALLVPFAHGGVAIRVMAVSGALLGMAVPGRSAIMVTLLLAAAWPRVPALAAATAAIVTGALLQLIRPSFGWGPQTTGTVTTLMVLVGFMLGASAFARARMAPDERGRHTGLVLGVLGAWLGLTWGLVSLATWAAGGEMFRVSSLRVAVAGSPTALILEVALTVTLLVNPKHAMRAAAAVMVLLITLTLWIGSAGSRDRVSRGLFAIPHEGGRVCRLAVPGRGGWVSCPPSGVGLSIRLWALRVETLTEPTR